MFDNRIGVIAALALTFSVSVIADVPSRPANPRELAVIKKVVTAVDATFDHFESNDWQQRSATDHEEFDVATNPDRPLNFAMQC